MPAPLPPNTAFTYAAELSVDEALVAGATEVRFDQPVSFYVDNFLDFPTGEIVPIGYCDRGRGVWVPSDDGRVIEILGVDAQGRALVDATGEGTATSATGLADLGLTQETTRSRSRPTLTERWCGCTGRTRRRPSSFAPFSGISPGLGSSRPSNVDVRLDALENLLGLSPPGKPEHAFTYTPTNLTSAYDPPTLNLPTEDTVYAYNLDRELELETRPTGTAIDYVWGPTTGRLEEVVLPRGTLDLAYDTAGRVSSLSAPGIGLSFTYDGPLLLSTTWSGTLSGAVTRAYNRNFWVSSVSVNGTAVAKGYDNDGLLTSSWATCRRPTGMTATGT